MAVVTTNHGRPGKVQTLSYSATPATSAAFGTQTFGVRLISTTACTVNMGDTIGMLLAPLVPEVFTVSPGQTITVAELSSAGQLCIVELE